MSPLFGVVGARLLKLLLGSPTLLPRIVAEVKAAKQRMPSDAEIQALPDDEAAIAAFRADLDAAVAENAGIQARLQARVDADARPSGGSVPTGD